jgi:oligopeptide transport system substrate-binding protein
MSLTGACPEARRRTGFLLALALLAGCNGPGEEEPPLRIDLVSQAAADRLIEEQLALGLTRRDSAGLVVPGLAQSWRVSEDGLSVVFRLRAAAFAGGADVTGADVVQTLDSLRRRGPAEVRALLGGISRIEAPLPDVVEVRLSTPQPELLELLAEPSLGIRPRGRGEVAEAGLGPFRLGDAGESDNGGPIRLQRNDGFLGGPAVTEELALRVVEPDAALTRFQRRETDLVTGGGIEGFPAVRVLAPRDTLRLEPSRAVLMFLVNQREGPLADLRVRRALNKSLDRGALARLIFGTEAAAPVTAIVPRSLPSFALAPEPDWTSLSQDERRAEAARLLEEAGIGPDAPVRLTVAAGMSQEEMRLLERVGADWGPLGIELQVARLRPEALATSVEKGGTDLALVLRRSRIDSPLPFLLPLGCRANAHGVCIEEADELIATSWQAPSLAERLRAIAAAERLWSEDVAIIALFQPLAWSLVQPGIEGFEPNQAGARSLLRLVRSDDRRFFR